jgi:hypothetical protein
MQNEVKVDFISFDKSNNEYVMYLVEDGPWPKEELEKRLSAIQDRIYDAIDVSLEGIVLSKLPESNCYNIRIQVDFYGNQPKIAEELVARIRDHIAQDDEYRTRMRQNQFIKKLRIVMGKEMDSLHQNISSL